MRNKQNLERQTQGDRFIPTQVRSCAFQLQYNRHEPQKNCSKYQELLGKNILEPVDMNSCHKIMNFGNKQDKTTITKNASKQAFGFQGLIKSKSSMPQKKARKISKKPYKVLQAPNLQDDFYLNLLDWSSKNQIAVGLDRELYLWSGCSTQVTKLYETSTPSDYICSVSFCDDNKLAIGNSLGQIKVFDIVKMKKNNNFQGHRGRVGSLDWNSGLLASGSRDGTVATWDLRSGIVNKYQAHGQEICGLRWSPDGTYIASGGNDNKLVVYDHKQKQELVKFHQHKAAVKAIGWCPSNPSILASGGGTADRNIRFFSTNTCQQSFAIDTGSQICNLLFSKISNQMVTTHGYSLNQINVWNTSSNWEQNSITKMATLTGHTYRVLYLANSPDGQSILTGAGDESLRFWNVFDSSHYRKSQNLNLQMDLR